MADGDDEEITQEVNRTSTTSAPPARAETASARLVVLSGDQAGRKLRLGDETLVGRDIEATLRVEDRQVSRHHVRIRRTADGDYQLEDLGTRNGTRVNGLPVTTRHTLSFGDRVAIGTNTVLLFTPYDPLEDRLLEHQKMEALGRLGAGVAHDFNNLLGAVLSSLEYLDNLPSHRTLHDGEVQQAIGDVRTAASRAAELTKRLLGFARQTQQPAERVHVAELCRELGTMLHRIFPQTIRIETELTRGLTVVGGRAELYQLLMNLCLNARDAMPEGGTLSMRARTATDADCAGLPLPSAGEHILIEVQDTGIGMDADTRRRAFEPFFTSKERAFGAGLGLATVFDVTTAHGGYVDVQSEPGRGTRFQIFLPAAAPASGSDQPPKPERTSPISSAGSPAPEEAPHPLVLLVDDEAVVRRSTGRLLRRGGYDVVYARDGYEAIEVYKKSQRRPDVVLLDLDMPNLDGEQTYRKLRQWDPQVRVIFISGYWEQAREDSLRAEGALDFLRKPFEGQALCEIIGRVLA